MVPADLLLLASSNDKGGAYIETSSINGETHLKLKDTQSSPCQDSNGRMLEGLEGDDDDDNDEIELKLKPECETLDNAAKRLTRFSA